MSLKLKKRERKKKSNGTKKKKQCSFHIKKAPIYSSHFICLHCWKLPRSPYIKWKRSSIDVQKLFQWWVFFSRNSSQRHLLVFFNPLQGNMKTKDGIKNYTTSAKLRSVEWKKKIFQYFTTWGLYCISEASYSISEEIKENIWRIQYENEISKTNIIWVDENKETK